MTAGSFGYFGSVYTPDTYLSSGYNLETYFVLPVSGHVTQIDAVLDTVTSGGYEYAQCGIYQYAPGSKLMAVTGSVYVTYYNGTGIGSKHTFPIAGGVDLPPGSYSICGNCTQDLVGGIYISNEVALNRTGNFIDEYPISSPYDAGHSSYTGDYILGFSALYDDIPNNQTYTKNITESYGLVETVSISKTAKTYSLSITETLGLTEVFTRKDNIKRSIVETYGLVETVQVEHITSGVHTKNIVDKYSLVENVQVQKNTKIYTKNFIDTYGLTDSVLANYVPAKYDISFTEEYSLNETVKIDYVPKSPSIINVVNLKILIDGIEYFADSIDVNKSISDNNATSDFSATFRNYNGQYSDTFNLNDEVIIYCDIDSSATTKLLTGIIENVDKNGDDGFGDKITISGRDYGAILQDILINPRIYKKQEISKIVLSLMTQNAGGFGITTNNVNVTTTTIDKITFSNKSLYDCIQELAEIAGYYFYVDINKDLHFEERSSVSSGLILDKTNIIDNSFKTSDDDIFNYVKVYGDRQLTGVREVYGPGEVTGSVYTLDDKPSNTVMYISGTNIGSIIQPGGILNVDNPNEKDVKWLVDYDTRQVILTSGAAAGDNTGWTGSGIVIDYQRSSPILSIYQDSTSQTTYGRKDKTIIDRNIKSQDEAALKAQTYLSEHKNEKIEGNLTVRGVLNITPGQTCIITNQVQGIDNEIYDVLNVSYNFDKDSVYSAIISTLTVNKKIRSFSDYMKEIELRLRALESSSIDTAVTENLASTGSIGTQVSAYDCIKTSIGSGFRFNIPNHNLFNSPSSLIGRYVGGSEVISYAI